MKILARLPGATLVAALAGFTLLVVLMVMGGAGLTQPLNLIFFVFLAATIALLFAAQNPNNEHAARMLWFSAGVWGAAAYLNFQLLGVVLLLVAALAAASAFWVERESRAFSFTGPLLFIGAAAALVMLTNFLAR